jgi:hypothetical protein
MLFIFRVTRCFHDVLLYVQYSSMAKGHNAGVDFYDFSGRFELICDQTFGQSTLRLTGIGPLAILQPEHHQNCDIHQNNTHRPAPPLTSHFLVRTITDRCCQGQTDGETMSLSPVPSHLLPGFASRTLGTLALTILDDVTKPRKWHKLNSTIELPCVVFLIKHQTCPQANPPRIFGKGLLYMPGSLIRIDL